MILWLIAILINLVTICNITRNTKKEMGAVDWSGVAWLTSWAIILGPFFTALTITYLILEHVDD